MHFTAEDTGSTVEYRHLVILPEAYDPAATYPLILFLHGSGERGSDLSLIATGGGPMKTVRDLAIRAILVTPQCEANEWWHPDAIDALFDSIQSTYPIDASRIYITGLSMGGFGTWDFITAHPGRVAAAVPICGGGDPRNIKAIKDLPIRVYHGAKDPDVAISQSQEMVDALRAAGSKTVEFTVYPEGAHEVWHEAYADPKLYEWLLSQHR